MEYGKRNDHMVEKLSDNIFRIDEFSGANCYLVAGSERALLIDSGVGAGDLRGVAESLTDLPIELAVTHAHVDHIGGAWQFDKVYVPKVDINGFNRFQTKALVRKLFVATQPEMKKAGLSAKDVKGNSLKTEWVPIEDGHIFDLGEKTLVAKNLPGHTRGSIALIDEADKIIFCGDNICPYPWLFLPKSTSVEEWLPSAKWYLEQAENGYTLFYGHTDGKIGIETIKQVISYGEELLKKNDTVCAKIKTYPPKTMEELKTLYLSNEGAIFYRTNNIHKK